MLVVLVAGLVLGWVCALALGRAVRSSRRRLELAADAAHELRSPFAAIALAAEALRRCSGGSRHAAAIEAQLTRVRAALTDLEAARTGRRAPADPVTVTLERLLDASIAGWEPAARAAGGRLRLDWRAGRAAVRADEARLAQIFGNLVANAVEHGRRGAVVRAERRGGRVRVEVRNADGEAARELRPARSAASRRPRANRGRGLAIASRAAEEAGGVLTVAGDESSRAVTVDLPAAEAGG
jgi:signal transduction histidine kinase